MAIIPAKYRKGTDPSAQLPYGGSGANADSKSGLMTPVPPDWWNEVFGFFQALLDSAGIVPNGEVETVLVSQYVQAIDTLIANAKADVLKYSGGYDAVTNTPNLTTPVAGAVAQGNTYTVETLGTAFFGVELEPLDMLIAEVDDPSTVDDWTVVQANLNPGTIKSMYESNPDTNAFTDAYQTAVNDNTAARHTHANKAVLDAIVTAGSGNIITTLERDKLNGIEPLAEVNAPDATLAEMTTDIVGPTPETDMRDMSPSLIKAAVTALVIDGELGNFGHAEQIWVETGGVDSLLTTGRFDNPYQTIGYAITQLATPSENKPYVIHVGAGTFSESPIIVPKGVTIKGVRGATKLLNNNLTTNDFLTIQHACQLIDLQIGGTTSAGKANVVVNGQSGGWSLIRDCDFGNSLDAINVKTSSSLGTHITYIENSGLRNATSADGSLYATIGGVVYLDNVIFDDNNVDFKNAVSATCKNVSFLTSSSNTINLVADAATLLEDCIFTGPIGLNGHRQIVRASDANRLTFRDTNFSIQYCDLDTLDNIRGNWIESLGLNYDRHFAEELTVGLPDNGKKLTVGEGREYRVGALAWTYNVAGAGTFADKTFELFESDSATDFNFPSQTAGNEIYIGHPDHPFHGLRLETQGIVPSPNIYPALLAGETYSDYLVAEYWDGVGWAECTTMTVTVSGQAGFFPEKQSYGNELFNRGFGTEDIYLNKAIHENWTPNQPDGSMPNAYWLRFRIVQTLADFPDIASMDLLNSHAEIGEDGFTKYFGNARPSGMLDPNTNTWDSNDASPGQRQLYLSQNLDRASNVDNDFNNATVSRVVGTITPPADIDTSCPLKVKALLTPRAADPGNFIFNLYVASNKVGDPIYDTVGTAPVTAPNEQAYIDSVASLGDEISILAEFEVDVSHIIPKDENDIIEYIWLAFERDAGDLVGARVVLVHLEMEYTKWNNGGAR